MAVSDYYIQDNSDIEDKKLEAAKGLYASGNYAGALKIYLDMVNTSYSYKLYYEIGKCYYKLNDLTNAETYFKQSVSLEAVKNPSYVFLGTICYKKEDIKNAIEYWITAYSYKPDDESVCLNLASSYFSQNMRFQALYYYEKYLKYAKDKKSSYYLEIKKSIEEFSKNANEFYQKALRAISMKDNQTAIQGLEYAAKNFPTNFDINYLLGKLYFEEKQDMKALIYLKQAHCLDNKSLDVLERLSSVMINLGDYTGAYCCLKRLIPLVLNNQKEYLEIIQTVHALEGSFDKLSSSGHKLWAERYYSENNYHFALFEYENCMILGESGADEVADMVQKLRSFIKPEERIIKTCFEKGGTYYSSGDFRQSNKYFTKIMTLAKEDSSDYKFAKSRIVNV